MMLQVLRYFELSTWFDTVDWMPESDDVRPLERTLPLSLLDTFDAFGALSTVSTIDDASFVFASVDDHLYTTLMGFSLSKCRSAAGCRSMEYFAGDSALCTLPRAIDCFSGRHIVNCARTIHSAVIFGGLAIAFGPWQMFVVLFVQLLISIVDYFRISFFSAIIKWNSCSIFYFHLSFVIHPWWKTTHVSDRAAQSKMGSQTEILCHTDEMGFVVFIFCRYLFT